MHFRSKLLAGALFTVCCTPALAQTQQSTTTVKPQTPAKTQKTTTQSTSTINAVPDATGAPVAVQKTTDTTQTTTTQPANSSTPDLSATSRTTSTTTVAPDATGAPATTTTTTTTQPATDQTGAAVTAATATDVKAGVPVFDPKGGVVGKVESVSAKGAVVSTGKARASVPVSSFGKNDKGLVISMTKSELEAASGKAGTAAATTKATKTTTTKKPK